MRRGTRASLDRYADGIYVQLGSDPRLQTETPDLATPQFLWLNELMAWQWKPSKKTERAVLILLTVPITVVVFLVIALSTSLTVAWGSDSVLSPSAYLLLGAVIVGLQIGWALSLLRRRD